MPPKGRTTTIWQSAADRSELETVARRLGVSMGDTVRRAVRELRDRLEAPVRPQAALRQAPPPRPSQGVHVGVPDARADRLATARAVLSAGAQRPARTDAELEDGYEDSRVVTDEEEYVPSFT